MKELEEANELLQKGMKDQAEVYFDTLIKENIEQEQTLLDLADLAYRLGKDDEAIAIYRQIVDRKNTEKKHIAHYELGNFYQKKYFLDLALFHYQKAVESESQFRNAYLRLGNLSRGTGDNENSLAYYKKALAIKNDLFTAQRILLALNYIYGMEPGVIAKEHFFFGDTYCKQVNFDYDGYSIDRNRKINVGLVSGDFRLHSVSYFVLPLLKNIDCNRFRLFLYSNTTLKDSVTEKFKSLAVGFHDIVGLDHYRIVQLIKKDKIDMLIDLSGHTPKNKLRVFCEKPAPIQISYLGYPNTTGLRAIDYRIVDSVTDPPGDSDTYATEQLIRMPRNFSCFSSLDKENISVARTIPYRRNGYITFGSFNDISKLNDRVIEAWTRILVSTPDSRLLLKTKAFQSQYVQKRYKIKFREYGLEQIDRVIFLERTPSRVAHLKTYDNIDIALDTFPYNGTTTTFQALSMGVPVITLIGNMHAGRVGYSILSHMGLKEFVCKDLDEYVHKAVALAAAPDRILHYKRTLRDIMNETVCDEKRYCIEFEEVLQNLFLKNLDRLEKKYSLSNNDENLILSAVGDLVLARRMQYHYHSKGSPGIFNDCLDLFKRSDINVCNLETVISNVGFPHPKKERKPYYFRASSYLAGLLVEVPFHVCITGNNHAMDYGGEGLAFQEQFLDNCNILHCGAGQNVKDAMSPVFIEKKGIRIAIFSFDCVLPQSIGAEETAPGVFYIHSIDTISKILSEPINKAKNDADLIIVSPHWIENWHQTPNTAVRKAARELIDLGCDVVLGHSSHLLHGIEIYNNRPIVYDMGTILVDSIAGNKELRYAAIFQLVVKQKCIRMLKVHPVLLANGSVNLAPEPARSHVIDKILSLRENKKNEFSYFREGKALIIPLKKENKKNRKTCVEKDAALMKESALIRYGNQWRRLKSVAVGLLQPSQCRNFKPVSFQNGSVLYGAVVAKNVRVGSGFLIRVGLRNVRPLQGRYEVHVRGVCQLYGSIFDAYHPFANGLYGPEVWQEGENVIDETFIRPPRKIKPGLYKLFWGLKEVDARRYVPFADGSDLAAIAEQVAILPFGVSGYASGVDWNGEISDGQRKRFIDEFGDRSAEGLFFYLRQCLTRKTTENSYAIDALEVKSGFAGNENLVYLTLFKENGDCIRWGSGRSSLRAALNRDIEKLISNRRLESFCIRSSEKCGILVEILQAAKGVDVNSDIGEFSLSSGIRITDTKKRVFILTPAEAAQTNLLLVQDKISYLRKKNRIREELSKLKVELLQSYTICQFKEHIADFAEMVQKYSLSLYKPF